MNTNDNTRVAIVRGESYDPTRLLVAIEAAGGEPMSDIIDLANRDDAGFSRLYQDRIEPTFHANEEGRIAAVVSFRRRGLIAVAATLAAAALAWLAARDITPVMFFGLLTAGIGAGVAYHPLAQLGKKLKGEYCTAIAEAMGATFTHDGFAPPAFERIKALGLVPGYSRSKFEDLFQGDYKDSRFELYEGHLEQRSTDSKGRTRYTTVFRGQLIRMHFPRSFLGVTIVRRTRAYSTSSAAALQTAASSSACDWSIRCSRRLSKCGEPIRWRPATCFIPS